MKDYNLFLNAKTLIRQKQYQEATNILKKLHTEQPKDSIISLEYAKILLKSPTTKEEGEKLLIELSKNPNSMSYAIIELGKYKVREEQYDKAREYFKKLLTSNKKTKNKGLLNLGWLESSLGNNDQALIYFNELLTNYQNEKLSLNQNLKDLKPNDPNYKTKQNKIYSKLASNSKKYFELLNKLSLIYLDMRNTCNNTKQYNQYENQACEIFKEIIENDNDQIRISTSLLKLGKINSKKNQNDIAETYFQELLKIQSNNYIVKDNKISALLELGKLKAKMHLYTEAREIFNYIIENDPKGKMYALLELGILEESLNNFDNAYLCFTEIINNGNLKDILFAKLELGKLYKKNNYLNQARAMFESIILKCSEIPQNNKEKELFNKSKNIAMLELGILEMNDNNFAKAREILTTLSEENNLILNRTYAIKNLIYLDIREEKYQEAYITLAEIKDEEGLIKDKDIKDINFYLKYKLKILTQEDLENLDYFKTQLLNYNIFCTVNYINNANESNDAKLNKDINLNELLPYLEQQISNMKPTSYSLLDKYIVDTNFNVCTICGESSSRLEVLTIPNTKNIISISPKKDTTDYKLNNANSKKLTKNVI